MLIKETAFSSLEEEYTPEYCLQLEAAYGAGMMSEGGVQGIEYMFDSVSLEGKIALDIGSGLGGVAFYLADQYAMHITGLEVNSWMLTESLNRIPEQLQDRVDFILSSSNSQWPFPAESYDMIYSKGVLTHVEAKDEIFQECHRLLKKDGLLVITDWLSSEERKWGKNIAQLLALENLILFPESISGYIEVLKQNGFTVLSARDDSSVYLNFNREILQRLSDSVQHATLVSFSDAELHAARTGYEAIAKALEDNELRVFRFIAQKNA